MFDVLGKCMGYTDHTPPKRELLLEDGMTFMFFPLRALLGILMLSSQSRTRLNEERRNLLAPRGTGDRVEAAGWPDDLT